MRLIKFDKPIFAFAQLAKSLDTCVITLQKEDDSLTQIELDYETAVKIATDILEQVRR